MPDAHDESEAIRTYSDCKVTRIPNPHSQLLESSSQVSPLRESRKISDSLTRFVPVVERELSIRNV